MSTPSIKTLADEAGGDDGALLASAQISGSNTPATSTRVDNNSADNEKPGCYGDELPPRAAVAGGYSSSNLVPPATSNSEGLQRHMHRLPADGLRTSRPQLTGQAPSVLGPSSAILTSTGLKRRPDGPPDFTSDATPTQKHAQNCTFVPQQLAGWAAVEKTLTDYDRQEIGGYKEDIDSLLTFAGLYSAVLTAFVIVSFTQLQEDTAAESLKVLRLIANQTAGGAALGEQLANPAVSTLADPPQFHPSAAAIRVNVLWFASLVISLSTASFAIFVKQWLRSYMAFTSTSPHRGWH